MTIERTPDRTSSQRKEVSVAFTPKTWSLDEFMTGKGVPPTNRDPQTGGNIWKTWLLERTEHIDVVYANVNSGNRTGIHIHPDTSHYTCIISGIAVVWMDGTMLELHAGDVVNIPINVLHNFGAKQGHDVWLVDLTSPPWDPTLMIFQPEREAEIAAQMEKALE
jgi:mannose-6-phosphate isomerase-like protein (cupin superfamily)